MYYYLKIIDEKASQIREYIFPKKRCFFYNEFINISVLLRTLLLLEVEECGTIYYVV